jgi:RND family efflux transporter MFP subunit
MKKTVITTSIIGMTLCVGVLFMVAGCGSKRNNTETQTVATARAKVKIAAVSSANVPVTDVYPSTVLANVTNNIAPQSSSRIQKIYAEVGDFVKAGQIVAVMDDVQLKQSELTMKNDSTEYSRLKKLYNEGGVSKSDLDASALVYNVARSQYNNLLENTVLRSPVSGVITVRNYDRGDMFSMGTPVYVVKQITPVKMLVGISESDYTKVKKNDKVSVAVDALPGKTFTGHISRIYPTMDSGTHTFNAEVLVNNYDKLLRPGMYARVTVTFASEYNIVVPDNCVLKQQGSGVKTVFVLDTGNVVKSTVVTVGSHVNDQYEILSGLKDGDKIVVEGQSSLKDGEQVDFSEQ